MKALLLAALFVVINGYEHRWAIVNGYEYQLVSQHYWESFAKVKGDCLKIETRTYADVHVVTHLCYI